MSTVSTILWSVGGVFIALCLLLAATVGIRVARRRETMNAARRMAHREFGEKSRDIGPWRWFWMNIRAIPFLLSLCVVIVAYLIVGSIWCLFVPRPKSASTSAAVDDDQTV